MHLEACCGDPRLEVIAVEVKGAGDEVVVIANVFYVGLVDWSLCSGNKYQTVFTKQVT